MANIIYVFLKGEKHKVVGVSRGNNAIDLAPGVNKIDIVKFKQNKDEFKLLIDAGTVIQGSAYGFSFPPQRVHDESVDIVKEPKVKVPNDEQADLVNEPATEDKKEDTNIPQSVNDNNVQSRQTSQTPLSEDNFSKKEVTSKPKKQDSEKKNVKKNK